MPSRHTYRPIETELDRFAELISRGDDEAPMSVPEVAAFMGKGSAAGNAYMQRLRKEMGDQAR